VASADWLKLEPKFREVLAAGVKHREVHRRYEAVLRPEAWTMNLSETRNAVAEVGGHWWRFLSGRWRAARKTLGTICTSTPPAEQASQLALLDAVADSARCAAGGERRRRVDGALAGGLRGGATESDWDLLTAQVNWTIGAWKGIGQGTLATWCVDANRIAVDRTVAAGQLREVDVARQGWQTAVANWATRLQVGDSVASQPFGTLQARWMAQSDHVENCMRWSPTTRSARSAKRKDCRASLPWRDVGSREHDAGPVVSAAAVVGFARAGLSASGRLSPASTACGTGNTVEEFPAAGPAAARVQIAQCWRQKHAQVAACGRRRGRDRDPVAGVREARALPAGSQPDGEGGARHPVDQARVHDEPALHRQLPSTGCVDL